MELKDARISFRAGAPLAEALAQCAERAGCSVSEYLRSVVREHVGLSEPPPPINIAPERSLSVHELAARGDGAAYAHLADLHYNRAINGDEPRVIAFARSTDCMRFACMARGERQDWLNFLFLLDCQASALRSAGYGALADKVLGEAVALAEYMADDGDEEMSNMVASAAGQLTPEALNVARDLRAHVKEAIGC